MVSTKQLVISLCIIGLIVLGAIALVNIFKDDKKGVVNAAPLKIGFIGPLTGDAAAYGIPMKNAADLALSEINNKGGINGRPLVFVYEEGGCGAKDSTNAAQKLINIDNVKVILGGVCSGETLGAAPIAEASQVILFSPGSGSPDITKAGDYIFRNFPSDATSGNKVALAALEKGHKNIAIINEITDYAQAVKNVFKTTFVKNDGKVVAEESFTSDASDFRSQLVKIKNANPDGIYLIAQTPATYGLVLKQMRELGITQQLYTNEFASAKDILGTYETEIEGAIFAEPSFDENAPKAQELLNKIKNKYGEVGGALPPVYLAASYDAVYILTEAINDCDEDTRCIKEKLYNIKNREGIAGKLSIDDNGDAELEYVLKTIDDGKVKPLSSKTTNKLSGNAVLEKNPIKLGASLPLTGEGASFGEGGLAGIELAVKEINDAGGINGRQLEVITEDDQCNNKGGINALTKLADIDDVVAIIGPICSAAAGPGLPVIEAKGIPIIIWGSAPHLTLGKDFVFRTTPSDSFAGKFTADYLYNTLNKKKVAVVYVQNDWGQGIRDVFVKRFKEIGGEIVFDEGVSQEAKDMRSTVTKIANAKPDAIYFPAYPSIGVVGLKQMKEQGINVPIIAGDAFDTDEVIKSGYAEGVMYVIVSIQNPDDFQARVKAVSSNQ
ncbi:MAG: ABC transporter substrate-binding protein, partial [Candidatus Aenigmarchaeota archaeon]|nr:ABC transporter substrate-binding protein [Candidatus Aenigmarchaeota archaeon]